MSFIDVIGVWLLVLFPTILIVVTIAVVRMATKRPPAIQVAPANVPTVPHTRRQGAKSMPTVPQPKLAPDAWTTGQEGYLDVRPLYVNLMLDGKEWAMPRKEILVGINVHGFEVLGADAYFTDCDGDLDRIAFWSEPEDGTPTFWLDKGEKLTLHRDDRLQIVGTP